ncbi:uncharacterized protein BKA55DRAFT_686719 [Fusarium redolens]|uniref:Uncharacterized protein n=1 Tax=Fusarium redolens TaxID=48865 RepID=A0A9P9HP78_FUSRE|nr:uncharacterized protein BKA55DRAFT_686719 [Fusarium redolens]KAH7261140.1 hypothetical protein BKA55DRAFT_686719 [Fusarium redolens]
MSLQLDHPQIGSFLGKRGPVVNVSPNFEHLPDNAFERTPMDISKIQPWSEFTYSNIVNAYNDVLGKTIHHNPSDEVPEFNCEHHDTMGKKCCKSLLVAIRFPLEVGKNALCARFGTITNLACSDVRHLRQEVPKHAQSLDFGGTYHPIYVFYDRNTVLYDDITNKTFEDHWHPFLATSLAVPSCTWESGFLATADLDKPPKLGPVEQLATCAKKTNTSFAFILGDKDIVVLQFFKTKVGGMGVY